MNNRVEKLDELCDRLFGPVKMFENFNIRAPYSDARSVEPKTWVGYPKPKNDC